jgi:LDH2 family malate/lactate/ureidoglycolate dehydrogenase
VSDELRIPIATLLATVRDALVACGVPPKVATVEAEIMTEADMHGVPSHGVRMLPGLLAGLRDGRVKADPSGRLLRDQAAVCVMDGESGPGRYLSAVAMAAAVERARRFGIGACLASRVSHWGRAHAYASRAAQAGCIGICTTNAITSMAAWGATHRVIGNNPLAIGIPGEQLGEPLVLDIAMSQAAVGKVGTWLREGREVPPGWGVDAAGKPTTDAKAILGGAVTPLGGHKGAGLALTMELLTAALAGGLLGNELDVDRSGLDPGSSKLFIALDIGAFGDPARFRSRLHDLLKHLDANAGETTPFQWPGQRGWQHYRDSLESGVPLHPEIVAQLRAAGLAL